MTKELAELYSSSPDSSTGHMLNETVMMGAIADVGIEFLREIAFDLLTEAGLGAALTAIPFIGGLLAAGLDATIAATLTWRVGTMVSAYYQHGGCWINNRQGAYKMASDVVGSMSPNTQDRADLNHMAQTNRFISDKQVAFVMNLIEMFRAVATNKDQIRVALKSKQIPSWLVEEGLRRAFA